MIKFFRHIRQQLLAEGKTGRYLKYAIGEIVLVVIGILIALQINNWNEDRKMQIAQKRLLINLYDDLTADSIILHENKQHMLAIIENHKQLHAYRKSLLAPDSINNPSRIRSSIRNYSITKSNHPDIASQVFNETLQENIRAYYRMLSDLENAYMQYDNVVKQTIRPYLANNLALNPDVLFDNQDQFRNSEILNLDQFYLIVKREEFGQILFELNLKAFETVGQFNEILNANAALRLSIDSEIK